MSKTDNGANLGFEKQLWATAEFEDDGVPFEEKMTELTAKLYEQLEATTKKNLECLGFGGQS